jgi:hypothetical protein
MAARRLVILMLILLGISTLAAALVPRPDRGDDEETATEGTVGAGTGTTAAAPAEGEPPTASRGKLLRARIGIGAGEIPVVPIKVGDNLSLEIRSKRAGLLEIPALGRVEAVSPGTPAFFDVRGREPASYGVRFLGGNRVVARIEVEPRKRKSEERG